MGCISCAGNNNVSPWANVAPIDSSLSGDLASLSRYDKCTAPTTLTAVIG